MYSYYESLLALRKLNIILKWWADFLLSTYLQDKKKDKVSAEEISGPLAIGGGTGIGKLSSQ